VPAKGLYLLVARLRPGALAFRAASRTSAAGKSQSLEMPTKSTSASMRSYASSCEEYPAPRRRGPSRG
jgi:hypothetical protein